VAQNRDACAIGAILFDAEIAPHQRRHAERAEELDPDALA
jgi:hypothetical protein